MYRKTGTVRWNITFEITFFELQLNLVRLSTKNQNFKTNALVNLHKFIFSYLQFNHI